ncbi:hypothetical protein CEUSTIGMA_g4893.t1 [Chlamydomonas eustigma]|uniref:Very-long-chain (3R)-3-hydroxyacyl-CoA dehydratase n=1 Tax=Chlamydomonas eustigma TaxID=1157962 RepID=A0A250X301_9CHLO|nr:hypothetical protein CEUSTIGMA_g4893.t1 [Chlamydomonas eustigma]|eukprot:GAX77448.1 hypothetical protein CEUSTIGMA_g4893.t1 [Chlamydomonas eustigma]
MDSLERAYLVGFNSILFLAWALVLAITVDVAYRQEGDGALLFRAVELPLMVAQTAAIMEVIHSAVGLIRSPVSITAMQVASRLWLVWGILVPVQGSILVDSVHLGQLAGLKFELNLLTLLLAWSCSELVRYGFFALKALGPVPYISLWLRYSAFIVMYPVGVASELTMVWLALPEIKASGMLRYSMPNAINFGFNYYSICILISLTYIPGLPLLYTYMLKQRNKMLGGSRGTALAQRKEL